MSDELQGAALTVLEGREGWLFLKNFGKRDSLALYTDPAAFTEAAIQRWAQVLDQRRRRLAARGIPFFSLIVPESCSIYPEKLPDDVTLLPMTPFERLNGRLDPVTAAGVIYPRAELIEGRSRHETYEQTDSHWTEWGAYIAYRLLMQRIREVAPTAHVVELEDITWSGRKKFGYLGALMTPERSCRVPIATIRGAAGRIVEHLSTEERDSMLTVECDRPDLPTALFFRDSFCTAMAPFLSESFRRVVYVSSFDLLYDLIDRMRPDVVVYERCERGMSILPNEPSDHDARARFDDLRLIRDAALVAQRRSRSALVAGRIDDALTASTEAIELAAPGAPGLGRAHVHRARIYLRLGNEAAALECLHHAMTLEPDAAMPLSVAAEIQRVRGKPDKASALLKQAANLEPEVPAYWDNLAICSLDAKDPATAVACSERSLAIDEHRWKPHLSLSRALRQIGDLGRARLHAGRAIEIDGGSAFAMGNLAGILVALQDWSAARDLLREAVSRYPDQTGFAQYLGLCEHRLGAVAV